MRRSLCLCLAALAVGCTQDDLDDDPLTALPLDQAPAPRALAATIAGAGADAPSLTPELRWAPPAEQVERAPIALTSPDGTALALRALTVRSVVQEPLAYTELDLVFENAEDRTIEGRFEITLPPGAAISRFAMEIDGQWQEGEVVEKQFARRVYEDFLHRRSDPALLEKKAGNQFSARVFPIPARGRKHIILSYSEELRAGGRPYEVQLAGLAQLESYDAQVTVERGGEPLRLRQSERGFTPGGDLRVPLASGARSVGVRAGDLAITRIQPSFAAQAAPIPGLTVLFDTSASRAPAFAAQVTRLADTLHAVRAAHGDVRVQVLAFDQALFPAYEGPISGFGDAQQAAIVARGALGASNPHAALTELARRGPQARVLLVSDGIATAGPTDTVALREAVAALRRAGVQRLDAIVDGGVRDEAVLAELSRAGLPHDGVVIDASLDPARVAERLGKATASGVTVTVPGADWVWPQRLDGLQPGDEVVVYAKLPAGAPVEVRLNGHSTGSANLTEVARPLVERAMTQAEITQLTEQEGHTDDPDARAELARRIVRLSTQHRVLSDHTALLVLETEADYARFEIDRTALAKVLVVRDGRLTLIDREPVTPAWIDDARAPIDASDGQADGEDTLADDLTAPSEGDAAAAAPSMERQATSRPAASSEDRPAPAPSMRVMRGATASAREDSREEPRARASADAPSEQPQKIPPAAGWTGRFQDVMALIAAGKPKDARALAERWHREEPGDVLALVALGEALEALGELDEAARAYGALIDLFPSRADMRRMAGERLERLGHAGLPLAVDTYTVAVAQRPDHPASHRLLAFALVKQGEPERAFQAIRAGAERTYPDGRFRGVPQILHEDVGLVAAAWSRAEPLRASEIHRLSDEAAGVWPTGPSLRFVLNWETDANDVDFHIYDAKGGHAYFRQKELPSGGSLYADVTTGYGPECFTISKPATYPYTLQAHYYSRGPMGYGMGKLEVIAHDGDGGLRFDERPFVVMVDSAYVDLGVVQNNDAQRWVQTLAR